MGQQAIIIPSQTGLQQPLTIDTRLTLQFLQAHPQKIQQLRDTLRVFLLSAQEIPIQKQLGSLRLPIHNAAIADKLKPHYSLAEFWDLFEFCRSKGTFDLTVDPSSGLAKTSGTQSKDDPFMGRLQWVTDVVHSGDILKDTAPDVWKKSLQTLAAFYVSEKPAFEKNIRNPALYHTGDPIEGVAHIFNPATCTRAQEWKDYLRLDSHGLALKAMADAIWEGVVEHQPGGFKEAEVDASILETLVYLAHYAQTIGYASARSSGPWEEIPFPGGLSSSIEAVRAGYEALEKLLFSPHALQNPELEKLRHRLLETETRICQSLQQPVFFDNPFVLNRLIQQGQEKLIQNLAQRKYPAESPGFREADASLVFITTSTLRLASTPVEDVLQHLRILDFLEQKLVRPNGMIRYAPFPLNLGEHKHFAVFDSYLGPNWSLLASGSGTVLFNFGEIIQAVHRQVNQVPTDVEYGAVGDPAAFIARGVLNPPGKEAEWFMVSEMAKGYGVQLEKLLQYFLETGQRPSAKEIRLLHSLYQKEGEYLNRSYARVTGEGKNRILANGRICPAFKVPEAYQYVSTVNSQNMTMVAGGNTPLSWATASLYGASMLFLNNLRRLEALDFSKDEPKK